MGQSANRGGTGRYQTTLTNLGIGIGGVAIFLSLIRGTRGLWEGTALNPDRVLGLATLGLVVGLGFLLVRSMIRLTVNRPDPPLDRDHPAVGLAIVWRLLALAALAVYALVETRLLAMAGPSAWNRAYFDDSLFELRRKLIPICGLLGMAGLVLGMVPGHPRGPAPGAVSRFW